MKRILPTVSQPGFFNLTAHFRSDSDFPFKYFHSEIRDSTCDHCLPNSTLLNGKTKFMVWMVSHCKTQSKREDYMAELSKYIKVDVFGKCGNYTSECLNKDLPCTKEIIEGYKFYFAAENSICKEYFTGKHPYYVEDKFFLKFHHLWILNESIFNSLLNEFAVYTMISVIQIFLLFDFT